MVAIVVSRHEKIRKKIDNVLEGLEIIKCDNVLDAIGVISKRQNECRLVLADFDLTPLDGVQFLEVVRRMNAFIKTALIIEKADEKVEIEALGSEIDEIIDLGKSDSVNRTYIHRLLVNKNTRTYVYSKGNELIVNDVSVALTMKEIEIISILVNSGGEIVGREEMSEKLWQKSGNNRKIDVHIRAIRAKLADAGLPNFITTVSGRGYRWDDAALVRNNK